MRPSSFVSSNVGLLDRETKQQHSEEAALLRPLVGAQNFQNLMGRSAEKKRGRARVGPMSKAPEGIEIFLLEEAWSMAWLHVLKAEMKSPRMQAEFSHMAA